MKTLLTFQGYREHGRLEYFLCGMFSTVNYRRVRNVG